jgi:hypothetical protein
MAKTRPVPQPSTQDVLDSLASAADAARQAYLAALDGNPGADLSDLYRAEMKALAIWSAAEDKALQNDPAIAAAQAELDAATQKIRSQLSTLQDVSTWLSLLNSLVQLAATVGKFFV